MTKHLFMGGSHDGERRHINELPPVVHMIKKLESVPRFSPFRNAQQPDPEIEEYKRIPFAAEDATFFIYAIKGMTAVDVVAELIAKYPNPED